MKCSPYNVCLSRIDPYSTVSDSRIKVFVFDTESDATKSNNVYAMMRRPCGNDGPYRIALRLSRTTYAYAYYESESNSIDEYCMNSNHMSVSCRTRKKIKMKKTTFDLTALKMLAMLSDVFNVCMRCLRLCFASLLFFRCLFDVVEEGSNEMRLSFIMLHTV